MPENEDFILEILVGETPLPEYEKDGHYYVESNLCTPYSYSSTSSESISGETESQSWPVTPYSLRLTAKLLTDTYYYRVTVDGVKVKGLSLVPGQGREIQGFKDGPCLREFLFSLPRFAVSENDRIEGGRECQIGVISVECWNAMLKTSKYALRKNFLDFKQANKKDSNRVTQGQHLMATSKAGKVVASRSLYRSVDCWKLQSLRSQLQVRYHMGHTLQEMGFTLVPMTWPKTRKRPSKSKDKTPPKKLRVSTRSVKSQPEEDDSSDDDNGLIIDEQASESNVTIKKEVDQPSVSNSGIVVDLTLDSDEDGGTDEEVDSHRNGLANLGPESAKKSLETVFQHPTTEPVIQEEEDLCIDTCTSTGRKVVPVQMDIENVISMLEDDGRQNLDEAKVQDNTEKESESTQNQQKEKDMVEETEESDKPQDTGNVDVHEADPVAGTSEGLLNQQVEVEDDVNANSEVTNDSGILAEDSHAPAESSDTGLGATHSESGAVSTRTPDLLSEVTSVEKTTRVDLDLDLTFDTDASFASVDFDSDALNSSADSEGGLKVSGVLNARAESHADEPNAFGQESIDPTVKPTTDTNDKQSVEPSNEPDVGLVTEPDPTVNPTTETHDPQPVEPSAEATVIPVTEPATSISQAEEGGPPLAAEDEA